MTCVAMKLSLSRLTSVDANLSSVVSTWRVMGSNVRTAHLRPSLSRTFAPTGKIGNTSSKLFTEVDSSEIVVRLSSRRRGTQLPKTTATEKASLGQVGETM